MGLPGPLQLNPRRRRLARLQHHFLPAWACARPQTPPQPTLQGLSSVVEARGVILAYLRPAGAPWRPAVAMLMDPADEQCIAADLSARVSHMP